MNWEQYRDKITATGAVEEDWYILGIDLGTTNSVVSYWNSKTRRPEPVDISNGFGKIPLPSVIQYREDEDFGEEWVVGEEALHTAQIYPETTVRSIKRKMGTKDTIHLAGSDYLPEELSSMILKTLIGHVSAMNPKMTLAGVVVSVPYDFDDAAKKATVKACHLAGLSDSLICLIEEPKAAALAYNFRHDLQEKEKVLVFDFGGGTLDITMFQVDSKDEDAIHLKVISEGGEAYHGGDNVDDILYGQLMTWLEEQTGSDRGSLTKESLTELYQRARETKERLSGVAKHRVPYTFCIPPFVKPVSRKDFEELIKGFMLKTRNLVLETLKECYSGPEKPEAVSRVLLEGGSSQMPWVKTMLGEIFGEDRLYVSEQPALDISIGATYYGAMKLGLLQHKDLHTLDRRVHFEMPVPHDIGFEITYSDTSKFYPMIRRGTPYPLAKKTMVFTLSGETLEDMTTLDLKIIERIRSGDDLEDCRAVGDVRFEGLPERPSGKTKLEVTLTIEENDGTVTGKVKDLGYGEDYAPSGFEADFKPERNSATVMKAG